MANGEQKPQSLWPAFALFGGLWALIAFGLVRTRKWDNPRPRLRRGNPVHPQALESLRRYKADLRAGHIDAAEYWRGQAGAYFTANPLVAVPECPKCRRKYGQRHVATMKRPSISTLERWSDSGIVKATDGCRVEPDGTCPHGHSSWMLVLGYI